MIISAVSADIRYTGRWAQSGPAMVTTAPGAYLECMFRGPYAVLCFDTAFSEHPFPHLYIAVDQGAQVETALAPCLRVQAEGDGPHYLKLIYKSGIEMHHRWYAPLIGKVALLSIEAEGFSTLEPDTRRTMEVVGDSITEGVLVEPDRLYDRTNPLLNRVYQDDVTATYHWLAAQRLNLRSYVMGYGAVGITKGGCGSVPAVGQAYPFCFAGAPVTYGHPDIVLINHGANDRGASEEAYIAGYRALLEQVRQTHPDASVVVLAPFCGAFDRALGEMVTKLCAAGWKKLHFISTAGWVPAEPLHPLREGHRVIADRLTEALRPLVDALGKG